MAANNMQPGDKHHILKRLDALETLAQRRLSIRQCAIHMRIPGATLAHYVASIPEVAEAFERGREAVNTQCLEIITKAITKGDEAMAKWWLEKHCDDFKRAPAAIEVNNNLVQMNQTQTINLNPLDPNAMNRAARAILAMQGEHV